MTLPFRHARWAWAMVPVVAVLLTIGFDAERARRVEYVSSVAREGAAVDAASPTGYADAKRWLIVPEHNSPTYQWIQETQQMLARGDWRVRRVDYENSPFGRDVHAASLYRWWLVLCAWLWHASTGNPMALSVERAALFADPLLHVLSLVAATLFVARRFGAFASALVSLGMAALFPLASAFLPGVANDFGLTQVLAFWSVLLVLCGIGAGRGNARSLFWAGAVGGCGLWVSAAAQIPIIAGIGLGAILAALADRAAARVKGAAAPQVPDWRSWALGGAISSLLAYLIEYFPSHMDIQLRVNYPIYGVAWLGLGEILARAAAWIRSGRARWGWRDIGAWILAVAAVASVPLALWQQGNQAFLSADLLAGRLTNLPDGVVAGSLAAWMDRDGSSGALVATLAPLVLAVPAAWLLFSRGTGPAHRAALAAGFGPLLAALLLARLQIRWWNTADLMLLALVVVGAAATQASAGPRIGRWVLAAACAAVGAIGIAQLLPAPHSAQSGAFKFTRAEVEGLYERALSQWIADHADPGGAVVFVPPYRTSSFCFYGSLRGLGTYNWENRDGLSATFRIGNSGRPDETQALLGQHGITHIVIPSWDSELDDFARMGLTQPKDSFIYALHQTDGGIFPWLRALPYNLPSLPGFEEQSVLVLQVTDETDPATVRSRLVEYLIEMHQLDQASFSSRSLRRYPANLGALVALAQVAKARGDDEGFSKVFNALVSNLSSGSDKSLPWDRRVSLAVILALGDRADLSRDQVKACLAEADDAKIRYLTTGSLYHLLVLARHFGIELPDPELNTLAMKLLPEELRERF